MNPLAAGEVNVFTYGGGSPTGFVDPFGLARCAYSISSRKLRCRSNDGSEFYTVGPDGVDSGTGPCANNPSCADVPNMGPVQPKTYTINPDDKQRPGWWRLESVPPTPGWRVRTGTGRGGFAIHPGTRTVGCINIDKNNSDAMRRYRDIHELLKRDQPNRLFVTE